MSYLGKASIEVSNAEKGKDGPFLTAEEENSFFQVNYSKTLVIKSYKTHGRGHMAKYPTRRALLKQREEDAIRAELDAQEERLQHQKEVRELKQSLANVISARENDKEESKKQMDDMREEFRQLLQQVPISTVFELLFQPIIAIISLSISSTGYVSNHDHHT
jgi:hypothetical protein